MKYIKNIIFVSMFFLPASMLAQVMKGKIYDVNDAQPIQNVVVHNIFTDEIVYTDSNGMYAINVKQGELVEFKKVEYKLIRKRIHSTKSVHFDVPMVYGVIELDEFIVYGKSQMRLIDSIKTAEVFRKALSQRKVDVMRSPFTALSKDYRRTMAFQERYYNTERDKYVEFVFSKELIAQLSDLGVDSIEDYRMRFRPTYENMANWGEYEFYDYVKKTVSIYRTNSRYYLKD